MCDTYTSVRVCVYNMQRHTYIHAQHGRVHRKFSNGCWLYKVLTVSQVEGSWRRQLRAYCGIMQIYAAVDVVNVASEALTSAVFRHNAIINVEHIYAY